VEFVEDGTGSADVIPAPMLPKLAAGE
jgi:hypothetical protein